jgi:hypothetical protein
MPRITGPFHEFSKNGYTLIEKTVITNAQLLALRATPVNLSITPPAGGVVLVPRYAVFDYIAGSTGFTVQGDEDLMIEYADGTNVMLVCLADNNTGGIDFTGTTSKTVLVPSAFPADTMAVLPATPNEALRLTQVGAGEWNDGDGCLNITLVYDVVVYG